MGKVIELVLIAILIGIVAAGAFEWAKERFLKLGVIGRSAALLALTTLAVGIILIQEHVPTFEEVHFSVPVPIPTLHQFRLEQIQITTHAALVPCILFGIFVTFLSIADVYRTKSETKSDKVSEAGQLEYWTQNQLVLYPALAIMYKVYVSPGGSGSPSVICFLIVVFLGTLFFPMTKRPIQGAWRWALFIAFSLAHAGTISLAALL